MRSNIYNKRTTKVTNNMKEDVYWEYLLFMMRSRHTFIVLWSMSAIKGIAL